MSERMGVLRAQLLKKTRGHLAQSDDFNQGICSLTQSLCMVVSLANCYFAHDSLASIPLPATIPRWEIWSFFSRCGSPKLQSRPKTGRFFVWLASIGLSHR